MLINEKVQHIREEFKRCYLHNAEIIALAPGRINLIGEHTDYNGGWVMPAAIGECIYFGFAKNHTDWCNVFSLDFDQQVRFQLNNLVKSEHDWLNYLLGLLIEFKKRGMEIGGFDCLITSEIPMGAGVSSSSALECGFAKGLDRLFNLGLDNWELINMSQESNHYFLGIKGGILDQFSCIFGEEDHFLKMNCADRSFHSIPADLGAYELILLNSNVKHNHLHSGYNERAEECKEALELIQGEYPEVGNLSQAVENQLDALKKKPILYKRAKFVLDENNRVHLMERAVRNKDYKLMGNILNHSHQGLKDMYEVSCEELDLLVNISLEYKKILGSRMMGGGFGGCTINLVKAGSEVVIKEILERYKNSALIEGSVLYVRPAHGLRIIE